MSDMVDGLRAVSVANQSLRAERRSRATEQFPEAKQIAEQSGFTLERFSETHYRLHGGSTLWEIHPGNQRIRRLDGATPFIFGLGDQWDLLDVVKQALVTVKAWRDARQEAQQKGNGRDAAPA